MAFVKNKAKPRTRQTAKNGEVGGGLTETYHNLLLRAYRAGYSVVYLQRYLAAQSAYFILNPLVDLGELPPLTRLNKSVNKVLPAKISAMFLKTAFNFVNWCDGWKISDFREAARLLGEPKNPESQLSIKVHLAFQNDYPDLYESVFYPGEEGRSNPYSVSHKNTLKFSNCTINIRHSKTDGLFVASIEEIPDCEVRATTCDDAYKYLKQRYAIFQSIVKLNLLEFN